MKKLYDPAGVTLTIDGVTVEGWTSVTYSNRPVTLDVRYDERVGNRHERRKRAAANRRARKVAKR